MNDFLLISLVPDLEKARKGRRPGCITKFPGIVVFCTEHDKDPSHLYRVLTGERQSRSLVECYAAWLKKKKIAWPSTAAVKPKAA